MHRDTYPADLPSKYYNHDGSLPTAEARAWRRMGAFGIGCGMLAFIGWLATSGFIKIATF